MKANKENKGITLIALIITIIVLLILAGVSIGAVFGENGLIANLTGAKFKNEMKAYQEEAITYVMSEQVLAKAKGEELNINSGIASENPNREITVVIPDLKNEYMQKVEVINNEFYYVPLDKSDQTKQEVKWCFEVDIKVKGYSSYEDFIESEEEVTVPAGEYTAVNGVYACRPDLTGFSAQNTFYVTYDESGKEYIGEKISKNPPEDWYSYQDKKWANIVTISKEQMAYWVWIPRYVYSIDAEAKTTQSPKVKFVDKNNNYKDYDTNQITNYPEVEPSYDEAGNQTNYCLPEAFKWDGKDTAGIWVSKYEISTNNIGVAFKVQTGDTYITITEIEDVNTSSGATTFEYYINGERKEESSSKNYTYTGLKANTNYEIKIIARNASGTIVGAKVEKIKTTEKAIKELTKPDLTGFNPETTYYVTYDGTEENLVSISKAEPNDWYNYETKQWANIVTVNNTSIAWWVWIPKYEYKINSVGDNVETRMIAKTQTGATGGYQFPEAFQWDGKEIAGIWVSKYEISADNSSIGFQVQTGDTYIKISEIINNNNVGTVAKYEYYLNGEIKNTGTDIYTYTGLNANTEYDITVLAKDSDGRIIGIKSERIKTTEKSITELTKPDLTGFNPDTTFYVTYDAAGNEDSSIPISQSAPSNWYDYENKQWANIVTKNGDQLAYFTWMPKYEYKLSRNDQHADIRFIAKTQTGATGGYQFPEAFKWDGKDIAGIWVSKYEISQ